MGLRTKQITELPDTGHPRRLMELNEPVIGFYEDGGTRNASFVVLLSANRLESSDGGALILDAGHAIVRHVSADEFRRGFSGYILMLDTRNGYVSRKSVGTILAALVGFATIITLRNRVYRGRKITAQHHTGQL